MSMIYNINYSSLNQYEEPVKEGIFEYLISPCNDASQTLIDFSIKHSLGNEVFFSKNSYGFQNIRIRLKGLLKEFKLTYESKVQKNEVSLLTLEQELPLKEQFAFLDNRVFFIDNYLFFSKTPLTSISVKNKKAILKYQRKTGVLDYLDELNASIYALLSYKSNYTTVETTADDVLGIKKGVCQDYAHLFLAMCRENGLACRYVSGYLDQGSTHIGSAMMHAWVEVFVPGPGWVGFDPTNNLRVNSHYIKVCHGKDYLDCSPIKGVLMTRGENNTTHQVKVAQQ
jgi:transglutaminase-like putative cysteine protease